MKEKAWVLGGKLIFRFGGRGKPPCGPHIVFANPDNAFCMYMSSYCTFHVLQKEHAV